jgi:GntP family gluconate:H+ symporter
LTAGLRLPAFFALLSISCILGIAMGMSADDLIGHIRDGFGNIMKSLGILIVLGTTLGSLLEHNGSIAVLAGFIVRKIGRKFIVLSMNIIGLVVGMPIFCDSGFIILSNLNKSIYEKSGISPYITSVSLATGLLSVHCLIPPHPGASAAASLLHVDFGEILLVGLLLAIPASLTGYFWAVYAGRKTRMKESKMPGHDWEVPGQQHVSLLMALLPILVPVLLMAIRSFMTLEKNSDSPWANSIRVMGDPLAALSIGILLAILSYRRKDLTNIKKVLSEGAEKSGGILVIIGAGGSFGAILGAMHLGEAFSGSLPLERMGILFPFLITSLLKTAQGSSTVAIITAASLVNPLLPALHLDSDHGRLLCVLSMGAGSMILSHANDAYFWVIARFSDLDTRPMFKFYSLATLFMGTVVFGLVWLLSLWLLH